MRIAGIVALGLALAACQGEKKQADNRSAAGEVLPGSVSDAMLPLDTLRSQPPLAPKSELAPRDRGKPGAKAAASGVPAAASDATAPDEPAVPAEAPAQE